MGNLLLFLIIFSIVLVIIFEQIRLFYNGYLRSYKKEISVFLEIRNYVLVDTIKPKKKDWQRSPFKKPATFQFKGFYYTNGLIWSQTKYRKIIGSKGEKFQEFWIEINNTFFHKPILIFKDGHMINNKELDFED